MFCVNKTQNIGAKFCVREKNFDDDENYIVASNNLTDAEDYVNDMAMIWVVN